MPTVYLTQDRRIVLQDRQVPGKRDDQLIVDVDLCGICGSDLHSPSLPQVYLGGFVLGHEASGTIRWIGDDVQGWTVGQRVALNPNGNVDGTCAACQAGRPNFCRQATLETALGLQMDGSLAPQVAVFPGALRAVPESMSRYAAALVEPAATALHAVALAGDLTGRTVLVTGGGVVGQLVVRMARHRGAARIMLMEPAAQRRAYATTSGADTAMSPEEARSSVGDLCADVVIEASGSGSASALGLDALVPGGTFVVVGSGQGNDLNATVLLLKEITVRGSFVYNDEFDKCIELLSEGSVAVDDLVSVVAPIEDALEAFEQLRSASTMKALIAPAQ